MSKSWEERHAQDAASKPRLLLVDDKEDQLLELATAMEQRGFEVVKIKLQGDNPQSENPDITSCLWVEDIAKFAVNGKNRIDAVLTDIHIGTFPFGPLLIRELVEHKFNGIIAAHSSDPFHFTRLKDRGAIGVFHKTKPDETAAELNSALQIKGQGIG